MRLLGFAAASLTAVVLGLAFSDQAAALQALQTELQELRRTSTEAAKAQQYQVYTHAAETDELRATLPATLHTLPPTSLGIDDATCVMSPAAATKAFVAANLENSDKVRVTHIVSGVSSLFGDLEL